MLAQGQDLGTTSFTWPAFPLPASLGTAFAALLTMLIIVVAKHFDQTGGFLTLSVMLVMAFISTTFISMIYNVPQIPTTEILVGALSTSVGAVVAFWVSRKIGGDHHDDG